MSRDLCVYETATTAAGRKQHTLGGIKPVINTPRRLMFFHNGAIASELKSNCKSIQLPAKILMRGGGIFIVYSKKWTFYFGEIGTFELGADTNRR